MPLVVILYNRFKKYTRELYCSFTPYTFSDHCAVYLNTNTRIIFLHWSLVSSHVRRIVSCMGSRGPPYRPTTLDAPIQMIFIIMYSLLCIWHIFMYTLCTILRCSWIFSVHVSDMREVIYFNHNNVGHKLSWFWLVPALERRGAGNFWIISHRILRTRWLRWE